MFWRVLTPVGSGSLEPEWGVSSRQGPIRLQEFGEGIEMGRYGKVAVRAARSAANTSNRSYRNAWLQEVTAEFPDSVHAQNKACPRGAFVGLCEVGMVFGVPGTPAGRPSSINGVYAVEAVRLLRGNPSLAGGSQKALW